MAGGWLQQRGAVILALFARIAAPIWPFFNLLLSWGGVEGVKVGAGLGCGGAAEVWQLTVWWGGSYNFGARFGGAMVGVA
jgi:hypothetical protein